MLAAARAPLLALWYLDRGPVRGSLINSPVRPALRSRGRAAGIPVGADAVVDELALPPLPSMSWFNSRPNLRESFHYLSSKIRIVVSNFILSFNGIYYYCTLKITCCHIKMNPKFLKHINNIFISTIIFHLSC